MRRGVSVELRFLYADLNGADGRKRKSEGGM
jgi:hypothetical protein